MEAAAGQTASRAHSCQAAATCMSADLFSDAGKPVAHTAAVPAAMQSPQESTTPQQHNCARHVISAVAQAVRRSLSLNIAASRCKSYQQQEQQQEQGSTGFK